MTGIGTPRSHKRPYFIDASMGGHHGRRVFGMTLRDCELRADADRGDFGAFAASAEAAPANQAGHVWLPRVRDRVAQDCPNAATQDTRRARALRSWCRRPSCLGHSNCLRCPFVNKTTIACVLGFLGLVGCSTTVNAPPAAGCGMDSSVSGCGSAVGYSCANGDSPEQSDSSLFCSDGTPDGDSTLYCCIQFTSSTCAVDPSVSGCVGSSFGFSCTGSDSPDEADSTLTCSAPTPGNGESLYCCTD